MLKRMLERLLGLIAHAVIKKYRPKIVAITGSVGKTTTKSACVSVLQPRFRVRGSAKNFNNELGVPLTILGVDAPGRNPLKWFTVFLKGALMLVDSDPLYPQVLVLEMGADHPGDIAYLMSIAPPDVGVVTAVSVAHTEFFESVGGVLAEKKTIVTDLGAEKQAIISADDEQLATVVSEIRAATTSFGFESGAMVRGQQATVRFDPRGAPMGMEAQIVVGADEATIFIPGVLGRPVVYAALAAAAVGRAFEFELPEIQLGLNSFVPPPGRLRIIEGIKHTILIDDTYNASPRAATEALAIASTIHTDGRRIAVLGDMLELGALTEETHRSIGNIVASSGFDLLLTVGSAARFIAEQARASGMDDNTVYSFDNSSDAGKFLQERMKEGDVVLVKGSQGVRCERVVREVMAAPEDAEKLLVRQGEEWEE